MDPSIKRARQHVLRQIEERGYQIEYLFRGEKWKCDCGIRAEGHGHRHEVYSDDLYLAACELARKVGIDLRDG